MPNSGSFGARVREARLAAGLSQSELARAVAHITKSLITKSLVSQWEVGRVKDPKSATLVALQQVLGVRMEWLATGKGPREIKLLSAADVAAAAITQIKVPQLEQAIRAALDTGARDVATIARAAAACYATLETDPNVAAPTLSTIAKLIAGQA